MKKIFNNPEIEIMILGVQDIITTSAAATGEDPIYENECISSPSPLNTTPSHSRHLLRTS